MKHTITYNHQSQFIEMPQIGKTVKLGELCSLRAGKNIKAERINPKLSDNLYPCYGGNGIRGYVDTYTNDGNYCIIGRQGALCGNIQLAEGKFYLTEHGVLVNPFEQVEILWLFYALTALNLNQYARGVAQPGLAVNQLEEIQIFVPDIHVQEEFAEIVRQADKSKFDGFKSQFIEMFGCDKCAYLPLREVCLRYGEYGSNTPSIPFEEGHPRYIRITDLNYDGTLNDDKVCAKEIDNKYILSEGDFLFARTGATVGKTYCHTDGDALYAGYLIRYVTNPDKILPKFLSIYTKTQSFWSWIKGQMKIGAQPNISSKQYNELPVPVPSIEEQTSFLSFVRQADKSKYYVQNKLNYICHILTKQIPLRRCS